MRTKSAFWVMILALLASTAVMVSAQTDGGACPAGMQETYAVANTICASVAEGEACLGKGRVSITSSSGSSSDLVTPGDRIAFSEIQRLQTRSMVADPQDWTALVVRLGVTRVGGGRDYADMIVAGDVVVWRAESAQAAVGSWPTSIEADTGVIVRQDANTNSATVWQLRYGEAVQALGRSADGQWIRILLPSPNGGTGWVFGRFVAVDGGSDALPYQTNFSPIPSLDPSGGTAPASLQRLRMESLPISDDCVDATDSGVLLQSPALGDPVELELNGVTLRLAGTAFLSAQVGGDMTVYNLEGAVGLIVDGVLTDLPPNTLSRVPLDATMSPITAPVAPEAFSERLAVELANLPLRLLSRSITPAEAQTAQIETGVCPSLIEDTYQMASTYCSGLATGNACIGNVGPGTLDVLPRAGFASTDFDHPGAMTATDQLERLSLSVGADPGQTWPAVMLRVETDTSRGSTANATILLLGEVELTNRGSAMSAGETEQMPESDDAAAAIQATIQVAGSVRLLAQPRVDTDSVALVDDQDLVTALQRSLDQQWIRIETAAGERGWVFAQFLRLPGDINQLPVYDPDQPQAPDAAPAEDQSEQADDAIRQAFDIVSRDSFPACDEVPPAGALIQSDSDLDGVLLLSINGAVLELNGTAYLTASDESLSIYSLEGAVSINSGGDPNILFAGQQMIVPQTMGRIADAGDAMSRLYSAADAARLASLPFQLLPRSFDFVLPDDGAFPDASGEQAVEVDADGVDDEPSVSDASEDEAPGADCIIRAGDLARNLRQGPGTDFSIVDVLRVGQSVLGESQRRGTFGYYWYKTDRGWIRFDAGEMSGGCATLPFYIPEPGEFADEESDAPPLHHEFLGDVCAAGGAELSAVIQRSGSTYHEFGGVWTGQAGASATFNAISPYYHESFGNVIAFVNEDGSLWLGSLAGSSFTINFAADQRFRVRISGLLGDRVVLSVTC